MLFHCPCFYSETYEDDVINFAQEGLTVFTQPTPSGAPHKHS